MSIHGNHLAVDLSLPERGHEAVARSDPEPAAHAITLQQEQLRLLLSEPRDLRTAVLPKACICQPLSGCTPPPTTRPNRRRQPGLMTLIGRTMNQPTELQLD